MSDQAARPASDAHDDLVFDALVFDVRGRRCALPVTSVREVLAPPPTTPVPLAPAVLRGIVPVHGHGLPLLDLGVWLSAHAPGDVEPSTSAAGRPSRTPEAVLVIEEVVAGEPLPVRAALLVERVHRVISVAHQRCRPAPAGPAFVSATVLDVDGPALLLDAAGALADVMAVLRGSREARS